VSYLTLRKLAKAKLEVTTSVLHDALLETFPEYERKIEFANRLASEERRTYVVTFNPRALSRHYNREYGGLFGTYELRKPGFGLSEGGAISVRSFLHGLRKAWTEGSGEIAITYVAKPQTANDPRRRRRPRR
jgi:hypothetical protein